MQEYVPGASRRGTPSASTNPLDSASLPELPGHLRKSAAAKKHENIPQPPSYIWSPNDIANGLMGKLQRDCLHKAVWAFREAFGGENRTARYLAVIEKFQRIGPKNEHAEAIRQMSSPSGYAAIRQAGRMRISFHPLEKDELKVLCREIRAALVWRSKFP